MSQRRLRPATTGCSVPRHASAPTIAFSADSSLAWTKYPSMVTVIDTASGYSEHLQTHAAPSGDGLT